MRKLSHIETDALMDELEDRGYDLDILPYGRNNTLLDNIDTPMLNEIIYKFYMVSWQERKDMYNKIMKL